MDLETSAEKQNSKLLKLTLIVFGFTALLIFRKMFGQFGISLGYLYITLILISGYWFYILGGVISAIAAFVIFSIELYIFQAYPFRELVVKSALIRLPVYLLTGICMGYLSLVMQKMKAKLESLELYDAQTGCLNSMQIIYSLEKEIEYSRSADNKFTLALIDVDSFKDINKDKKGKSRHHHMMHRK